MKKFTPNPVFITFLALLFVLGVQAQNKDKAKKKKETEQVKKGWNLGALPVISYDSDLGFQYGALMNLYNYGNGSEYPNYRQSLYVEVSRFTKKSGIYRINYDTKDLIKGMRVYLDLSYMPDQAYSFYGFNGYDAVYNSSWTDDKSPDYKTRVFYNYQRKFFRMKADFMGYFKDPKFHWVLGAGYYNIKTAPVDVALLNKGKSKNLLPDTTGLFQHYINWGIIPKSEENGGAFTVLKAAFEYDSRDNEANPNRGMWTEIVLAGAPKFLSNMNSGFLKLSITQRQYFTIVKNRLTFAYRLGAQFNLAGHTPFYALPLMFFSRSTKAYNEGLGGSSTLRGILRNRVIGDGIAYGNFEFRWKFVNFHFIKQNFYLALSTFFDTGRTIQKYKLPADLASLNYAPDTYSDYFKTNAESFHSSAGLGFFIAMNQNFIISVQHGNAFNPQDGTSGTYVGLNYLF